MVVCRLEAVMDAQWKELELFKPKEKPGKEDRIQPFQCLTSSGRQIRPLPWIPGKKTRKRTTNIGKSQEGQCPNRRNNLEKKIKLCQALSGCFGQ